MEVIKFLQLLMLSLLLSNQYWDASAQLTTTFYDSSCPSLAFTVRREIRKAVFREPRIAASILRLHFHDCFVNGCDASILLDDTPSFTGEKNAIPNKNSARGFEVIDNVKAEVEKMCQGVVSCADILTLSAREAVIALQGPSWPVPLGRRDSITASQSSANSDIPAPTSTLSQLISKFQAKGLSPQDMVVLSGAHTIGQARCVSFRDRLYNFSGTGQPDPSLHKFYLTALQQRCGQTTSTDNNISPLDLRTPITFDNLYFVNLQFNRGLLNSDQVLSSQNTLVNVYASSNFRFFNDFASAMISMSRISPTTFPNGQIRRSCKAIN